jgi:hypothetical protein
MVSKMDSDGDDLRVWRIDLLLLGPPDEVDVSPKSGVKRGGRREYQL